MAIVLVILRVVIGLLFGAAAISKLVGAPMMVKEFGTIGLGQWFRYATALIELAGVVLLFRPRTVTIGSILLVCVCVGAFVTQLLVLHGDVFHTIVLGAIAAFLAWSYRAALATR